MVAHKASVCEGSCRAGVAAWIHSSLGSRLSPLIYYLSAWSCIGIRLGLEFHRDVSFPSFFAIFTSSSSFF